MIDSKKLSARRLALPRNANRRSGENTRPIQGQQVGINFMKRKRQSLSKTLFCRPECKSAIDPDASREIAKRKICYVAYKSLQSFLFEISPSLRGLSVGIRHQCLGNGFHKTEQKACKALLAGVATPAAQSRHLHGVQRLSKPFKRLSS